MTYTVEAAAVIDASPDTVYRLLADYRNGHPRILPPAWFVGLGVEAGGTGEGTVILVSMKVFGQVRQVRMLVTEPEPGRVLEEADAAGTVRTRFYVTPTGHGSSHVRISSELMGRDGMSGWVERKLSSRLLTRVYKEELELLAKEAPRFE